MSSWCSPCNEFMFGENSKPDWDIEQLFAELEKENNGDNFGYDGFLCEGCGLLAISIQDGKRKAIYSGNDEWVDYDSEKGKKE